MFGMFGNRGCGCDSGFGGGFGGGCEFLWLIILISLLCGNKNDCCENRCEHRCEPRCERKECGCGGGFDPCILIFLLLICGCK